MPANPLTVINRSLEQSREKFAEIAAASAPHISYAKECEWALQAMGNNEFLAKTALAQPDSLRNAIVNVAATGLTLNPTLGYAYLVPRSPGKDKPTRVNLDIGYRGMLKIATDTKIVESVHVDLVYAGDHWLYEETAEGPHLEHRRPRLGSDRGELEGGYCRATLPSGRVIVTVMTKQELEKIKASSPAGRKGEGPYRDWQEEMFKKALVRRAFKLWPKSDGIGQKIANVMRLEPSPDDGDAIDVTPELVDYVNAEQVVALNQMIETSGLPFDKFCTAFQIGCVDELPASQYDAAVARIEQYAKAVASQSV